MITTGWIESIAKKARVKQPCDTHARRNVRRLKMSHVHVVSCNENSWRGCRRVHRGDEAGSEGGMSSAFHLDCQTPGARLGIFQREADATLPALRAVFSPLVSVWPAAPPACICSACSLLPHQSVGGMGKPWMWVRVGVLVWVFVCVEQVWGRSQCTAEGRKRVCWVKQKTKTSPFLIQRVG